MCVCVCVCLSESVCVCVCVRVCVRHCELVHVWPMIAPSEMPPTAIHRQDMPTTFKSRPHVSQVPSARFVVANRNVVTGPPGFGSHQRSWKGRSLDLSSQLPPRTQLPPSSGEGSADSGFCQTTQRFPAVDICRFLSGLPARPPPELPQIGDRATQGMLSL
jgi:hypothetical protein